MRTTFGKMIDNETETWIPSIKDEKDIVPIKWEMGGTLDELLSHVRTLKNKKIRKSKLKEAILNFEKEVISENNLEKKLWINSYDPFQNMLATPFNLQAMHSDKNLYANDSNEVL